MIDDKSDKKPARFHVCMSYTLIKELKEYAKKQGIPASTLVRSWIIKQINQEI